MFKNNTLTIYAHKIDLNFMSNLQFIITKFCKKKKKTTLKTID